MSETCAICEQPIDEHEGSSVDAWEGRLFFHDATLHDRLFNRAGDGQGVAENLAGCVRALVKRVAALEARR